MAESRTLDVDFYMLSYHVDKAKNHFTFLDSAIQAFETIFGPYPFYRDGFGVVESPYLGMEHQSLIAYGSTFEDNEYGFDWLHFHELAHEWWANLATAQDWNDFWIHESFAN